MRATYVIARQKVAGRIAGIPVDSSGYKLYAGYVLDAGMECRFR